MDNKMFKLFKKYLVHKRKSMAGNQKQVNIRKNLIEILKVKNTWLLK